MTWILRGTSLVMDVMTVKQPERGLPVCNDGHNTSDDHVLMAWVFDGVAVVRGIEQSGGN